MSWLGIIATVLRKGVLVTVNRDSMAPALADGDRVLVVRAGPDALTVGDVAALPATPCA